MVVVPCVAYSRAEFVVQLVFLVLTTAAATRTYQGRRTPRDGRQND
jgi:deoxycytidine triphosphate deaminase